MKVVGVWTCLVLVLHTVCSREEPSHHSVPAFPSENPDQHSTTAEPEDPRPASNRHSQPLSTQPSKGKDSKPFNTDPLPDQPVQLLRPDPSKHLQLELIQSNVRLLHKIDTAVAVVAVVGKFHSGKSFLLNQLMGKQEGFGVGPTVRPQTMGIWMWGKPMQMELPSGMNLSVVFLDTEGFAASNVSEMYDAKIFSIATLLSSYLIYNSVKIIDQGDIDYLELLARRTQLFALRSQITKSHWFEEFNHDLLQFPPLVWVVQDFVQTTEEEESPQEWLHRIMDSSSREAADYDINLLGIFDSVDCHTLFLPAVKKALLQDLSKAKEEDLTEEYIEERNSLIARLKNGLVPKEKNGRPITGPELATLLEVLVTAANEGSLAEIPGRWEVFIDQLRVSALEDCATFYDSDMAVLLHKYDNGAINQTELREWHKLAVGKSKHLLQQLLFGLEQATFEAVEELDKMVAERYEAIADLNDKKIQLKCSEVQRRKEIDAEDEQQKLVFPMSTTKLRAFQDGVRDRNLQQYRVDVGHLSDNTAFHRHLEQLKSGLEHIFDAAAHKNKEALEELLNTAIGKATDKYREASKNHNRIPRTTDTFKQVVAASKEEAKKVFDVESTLAREESLYQPFLGHLKTKLEEEALVTERDNLGLIKTECQAKAMDLVSNFRHNTGSSKLVLPLNDSALQERLGSEKKLAFKTYAETQAPFDDTSAFTEIRKYLESQLEEICKQRTDENYQAYIREVKVPLNTAKKIILLTVDQHDTVFSAYQHMKTMCLINLDEGKAKHWQHSLKVTIAEKFIENSEDLQRVLKSKEGLWSTLKGFLLWLSWLISG